MHERFDHKKLKQDDYNRLEKMYPDLSDVLPFDEALERGVRMNMDLHPMLSTEIRYLSKVNGVGQGIVVRKMMEVIKKKNILLDFSI